MSIDSVEDEWRFSTWWEVGVFLIVLTPYAVPEQERRYRGAGTV
jgi:hypothetical protein